MNKETNTKRRRAAAAGPRVVPVTTLHSALQSCAQLVVLTHNFSQYRHARIQCQSQIADTPHRESTELRHKQQTPLCARRTTSNLGDLRARSPRLFCIRPSSSHRSVTRRRALSTHCIRQIPRRGRFLPTLPSDTRQVSSQAVRGRESALSAVQCVHAQMALL